MARMRPRLFSVLALLLSCALISGCWDIKSIQDINYFTGIGIDYVDGKYVVYVQQLDFSAVAKSESGAKNEKPAESWVGHAIGKSVSEAIMVLYQTTQQTVFWGHLSTIILSENILKSNRIIELFDALLRSPEIRMTPWVFGTKSHMPDIFSVNGFFNLSPLNTILYAPESSFKQKSVIEPVRLYKFMRELRDPGCTVLLPSLSISPNTWAVERKSDPKLEMNGLYALRDEKFRGWFNLAQIQGLKWMSPSNATSRLFVERDGQPLATLRIMRPDTRIRIEPGAGAGEPRVTFETKLHAQLLELWQEVGQPQIEQAANEKVRGDIIATMKDSIQHQADLFNIEHELYRKHFSLWNGLTNGGHAHYEIDQVPDIRVDVKLVDAGAFKLNRKLSPHD